MKELFHRSEIGNEPDKMMDAFQTRAKELMEDLNEILAEQRHEPDFPGQQVLTKGVRILANAAALNEESIFYDWISGEKENLLDLAEDLALSENPILLLDDLYESLKKKEKRNIHIDFFYYALDWLFIQSLIELQGRRVIYVNRKTDRAENSTLGGGYSGY